MAQHKYIPCDIYKRGIHVFVGTAEEFGKWMTSYFNQDEDEKKFAQATQRWIDDGNYGAASFHYCTDTGGGVILIPSIPKTPKDIAISSHECLHATVFVLDFCGVEYHSGCNNEPFTYLLEHLMRNALEDCGYETVKIKDRK